MAQSGRRITFKAGFGRPPRGLFKSEHGYDCSVAGHGSRIAVAVRERTGIGCGLTAPIVAGRPGEYAAAKAKAALSARKLEGLTLTLESTCRRMFKGCFTGPIDKMAPGRPEPPHPAVIAAARDPAQRGCHPDDVFARRVGTVDEIEAALQHA